MSLNTKDGIATTLWIVLHDKDGNEININPLHMIAFYDYDSGGVVLLVGKTKIKVKETRKEIVKLLVGTYNSR